MGDLTWTNETRRLGDLKPQEDNPRLIREKQADRLNESWDEYGQVDLLAVGPGGEIYNGHQRYYVLLDRHGPDHPVECRVASRPLERREWQRLTVLLHEGAVGEWDFDGLANWEGVDFSDLVEWGFDADKLGVVIEQEPPADPGPQIDRAEELREKWQTARGQIWQIGKHRLMCGDSTSEEDVGRLMDGSDVAMTFIDPPYAIYGSSTGVALDIADDKLVRPFFRDALKASKGHTRAFGHIYVCCDWRSFASWVEVAKALHIPLRNCIVWDKGDGGLGTMYQLCHEFVALFSNDPFKERNVMFGRSSGQRRVYGEPNIWRYDRVSGEDRLHNAAKPLPMIIRAIGNSSDEADGVGDWFLGSGTTMVAAEQTGRICYGMEIEPKYVAVTLERMAGMGLEPKLVES